MVVTTVAGQKSVDGRKQVSACAVPVLAKHRAPSSHCRYFLSPWGAYSMSSCPSPSKVRPLQKHREYLKWLMKSIFSLNLGLIVYV